MRWLAIAVVLIAAGMWAIALSLGAPPVARATAPVPDAAVARDAAADAYVLEGDVIDVAEGVKLVVPPKYEHARIDARSIYAQRYGIGFSVLVTAGTRHAQLHEPLVGITNYQTTQHLTMVGVSRPTAHGVLARMTAADHTLHVIYTIEMPTYRVVTLLVVVPLRATDPEVEQLIDQLVHDRLLLP